VIAEARVSPRREGSSDFSGWFSRTIALTVAGVIASERELKRVSKDE
jgi:hypothetical protein